MWLDIDNIILNVVDIESHEENKLKEGRYWITEIQNTPSDDKNDSNKSDHIQNSQYE